MKNILITGAAGRLGRVLRQGLKRNDRCLHLLDIAPLGDEQDNECHLKVDATDLNAVVKAMENIDIIVHLAAYPDEADWSQIFPLNYNLTYNVFEAARISGVKRVIFASSIQAVGFHPIETTISDTARLRPSGFYGVSKGFGESLASLYADKFGLSVACLRVASFESKPVDTRMLSTWLSHEDGVHLFDKCIDAPDFHFFRVFGVSNNTRARVDNSHVEWLGYEPQSNAEDYRKEIERNGSALGPVASVTHGGSASDVGFCGNLDQTLKSQ
ncbi:NAD-dependent epimerase/dehydratase family protein [Kiloniella antarctica]|uniref:NAD-dependent epimerase/dehydratase family protein n=1 Tax=Kiloniella antarctica TaxID=1550907 RepID=A0ABW5BN08_9PROT